MSAFSLSQDLHITVAQAKEYRNAYFANFSGVQRYQKEVVEQAKKDGWVSTLLGRRRWLPELKSTNFNIRSFGERVAMNMPIQGTAADII
jgi:DNA polymerase-1